MEELYYNVMEDLDTAGKVRGLDITFNEIDSADPHNLDDYEEQMEISIVTICLIRITW